MWSILLLGNDYDNKRFDRVLNGPTSAQWLDPWVEHLRAQGVTFQVGQSLSRLTPGGRHIASATVVDANGVPQQVSADWYVSAVPCEKLAAVLTHDDGGCQRGWARRRQRCTAGLWVFRSDGRDRRTVPGAVVGVKAADRARYRARLPHALDVADTRWHSR